ncbi:hypothetical protein BGX31_001884 [Mortierella sp. GBA43]|nr:hypothetical protein BGX31_001884 [Mortierella sp. GBA43]
MFFIAVYLSDHESDDGSTIVWKTENEESNPQLIIKWIIASGALVVAGSTIQGARGLSQLNKQFLKQHGTQGEPVYQLQEASNKMVAMASAVSRLKYPAGREPLSTSTDADQLGDQRDIQAEQQANL